MSKMDLFISCCLKCKYSQFIIKYERPSSSSLSSGSYQQFSFLHKLFLPLHLIIYSKTYFSKMNCSECNLAQLRRDINKDNFKVISCWLVLFSLLKIKQKCCVIGNNFWTITAFKLNEIKKKCCKLVWNLCWPSFRKYFLNNNNLEPGDIWFVNIACCVCLCVCDPVEREILFN